MKDDLFDQLQKAIQGKPENPPKGFMTTKGWAKKWGLSEPQAKRYINAGLEKKLMVEKPVRIISGKIFRAVPHYGPAKG